MKVLEDRTNFTKLITSSFGLAITVPAILLSAISFAKLGPLRTPIGFLQSLEITSDKSLNGFSRIPLVHEIKNVLSSMQFDKRFTICSKIMLGVAIKTIETFLTTSDKSSDAKIFSESFNSG